MNKCVLISAGLLTLIASPTFSQDVNTTSTPSNQAQTQPNTTATPATPAPVIIEQGATNTSNPAPQNPAPEAETPTTETPSVTPNHATTTTPAASATSNCNFKIPADTATVDNTTVMQWAEKAAQLTFTLDPSALTTQLDQLKNCYTEQGWQSFNEALKKSGNLDAIRKENLTVSSLPDGTSVITSIKDNQWKVAVPLQVVYQNGKEKIMQSLTINLIISRQGSGQLGIMQLVAMQRQAANELAAPTKAEATPLTNPAAPVPNTPAGDGSPATSNPPAAQTNP